MRSGYIIQGMLKRIEIKGYKSLEHIEVHLEPLTVLFGPNGAGKSNFLDALQLLSRLVTSKTLKDAFEPPYRGKPLESFYFGESGLKGLLGKDTISFSMEVDVELSKTVIDSVDKQIRDMKRTTSTPDGASKEEQKTSFVREKHLRYKIEIEVLPKVGFLRVADESLTALNSQGQVAKNRSPFLNKHPSKSRLHLRMEGQAHPTYYECNLDHSILSMPLYPPHYPHLVAFRQEVASWLFFYFEPRERMRATNSVKEVRHIGMMGEELAAFLNTLKTIDLKHFQSVEKALHLIIPQVHGIEVEVNEFGEVELRLREENISVPARVLSEGTLRILGLLALGGAKEPPALLGFEEPENGVHPRRVEMIADVLKNRVKAGNTQIIVTTHSPLFLDLIEDKYLFAFKKQNNKTSILPFKPSIGPLSKKVDIDTSLEEPTVSNRLLRGDFDA